MGVSNLLLLILLDSFSNHSLLNHCFTHSLQAFNQLEIATHIEMVASKLRRDATRIIKTVLAGTATEKLTNVLEAAFGEEEPPELRKAYEEALEEEEEEEEEGPIEELAPSTSKGGKRKQSAPHITKGAKSASQVPVHSKVPPFITRPPLMRVAIFIQELILSSCLPVNQATTLLLLVTAASSARYANRKVKLFPIATSFPPPKGN